MSIDDDSFDVEAALEGKPEAEAFDRFLRWAYQNSERVDQLLKEVEELKTTIRILKQIWHKLRNRAT